MRFRFSLRLFLILFTLLAIALGAGANFYYGIKREIARHEAACERLGALGVYVWYQPATESEESMSPVKLFARRWIDERAYPVAGGIQFAEYAGSSKCETVLEASRGLSGLRNLTLTTNRLTLKTVTLLTQLGDLVSLHLVAKSIEPDAAQALSTLSSLKQFTTTAPVSEETFGIIAKLPSLRFLNLNVTTLSPRAAPQRFPKLEQVTITGNVEGPEVIAAFAACRSLFRLSLDKCKVSHSSLAPLSNAQSIEIINLREGCEAPIDVLTAVIRAPNLKIVTIDGLSKTCRFDLSPLTKSKSLREVHLRNILPTGVEVQMLSIPQLEKLIFALGADDNDIFSFLKHDAKLQTVAGPPYRIADFEYSGRKYSLSGNTLSLVKPDEVAP